MFNRIKLSNFFSGLLCFFIFLMPLNNYSEVVAMMKGELGWGAWSVPITPVYIKVIKDLFIIICFFVILIKITLNRRLLECFIHHRLFFILNSFVILLFFISVFSFFFVPFDFVLIGFRAYWTILLVYAGACFFYIDERLISKVFLYVFFVHVILQIAQFLLGSGYAVFHENRSPGIFIVPSTAGAFALLAYYFSVRSKQVAFQILAILSIVLSASTMAMLILFAYVAFKILMLFRHRYELYIFVFAFVFFIFYLIFDNLGTVSGRGDGAYISLFTRLGYIKSVFEDFSNLAFGRGMGIATSQAVMAGMDGAIVADNTYSGAMLNLGWIATVFLFLFMLSSFFIFESPILFFIFLGFSMVTNFFEMSPVVHIMMILLGAHAMKKSNYLRKDPVSNISYNNE